MVFIGFKGFLLWVVSVVEAGPRAVQCFSYFVYVLRSSYEGAAASTALSFVEHRIVVVISPPGRPLWFILISVVIHYLYPLVFRVLVLP